MVSRSSVHRKRHTAIRPLVAFLIIASFGILFAGCKGPDDVSDNQDMIFNQQDALDRSNALASQAAQQTSVSGATVTAGTGSTPYLMPIDAASGSQPNGLVLDLSMVGTYNSIRMTGASSDASIFSVNNDFLNVRDTPATSGAFVARLNYGDPVQVIEFTNAEWAKVKLTSGQTGYVAVRYIARVTSDEKLAAEKAAFDNEYYVSYAFVNVRKSADQKSDKVGQIPGQTILKPTSISNGWAAVSANGLTGYVAMSYLTPFKPVFIVRQDTYQLPILHYTLTKGQEDQVLSAMQTHVAALKQAGMKFITFSDLRDLLVAQQKRDVQLDPKSVIVAITGVQAETVKSVSDALNAAGISATIFLQTQDIGLSGITEKMLLTLVADGFDIESATHTGDDLRALTNAQVTLELEQSRKLIEDVTQKPVVAIAYPQGETNDRVMQIAAGAGYLLGMVSGTDHTFTRDQLLSIPSLDIFPTMTADEVLKLVQ